MRSGGEGRPGLTCALAILLPARGFKCDGGGALPCSIQHRRVVGVCASWRKELTGMAGERSLQERWESY